MTQPDRRRITVSTTIAEIRQRVADERAAARTIGFVPTMGALHAGHASLVAAALARCDVAVASIFVNPLQFAPTEDLARYPRTPEEDSRLLEDLGCQHLYMPEVREMYASGFKTRVTVKGVVEILCGRSRPTHFSGVLTVVLKLINQVGPDTAFFGRKDYQQAVLVRRMLRDLDVPVEVEVCPIVREPDGLALSSRNRYLEGEDRTQATALREAVLAIDRAFRQGERRQARLLEIGHGVVARREGVRLDYLEIRDPDSLAEREDEVSAGDLVAIAAIVGTTRLIDNGLLGQE